MRARATTPLSSSLVRVVERARRLLALAAPSSNTTEAERANAAVRAAETIAANRLVVSAANPATSDQPALEPVFALVRRLGLRCSRCGDGLRVDDLAFVERADVATCMRCPHRVVE
jgi:hypothetical protein